MFVAVCVNLFPRRSPCGERGLKLQTQNALWTSWRSLPVRGAWVEILNLRRNVRILASLPVRGAWVEILPLSVRGSFCTSLPVRGAWVEMETIWKRRMMFTVAPRAGSVG